jgi:endonuclease VIII
VPEGDTIHKTARRLRETLAGRRVVRFELRRDPRGVRPPTAGTMVTDVDARGKHLLMHFDDGATLHTHMQLHGRWDVYPAGARWKRPAHRARVIVEVDDGSTAVCFDAPRVELTRDRAPRVEHLGPDLCVAGVDLDTVLANVDALASETPIGDALLDQRVAAGIGNVFKSEICWAGRVHPATPVSALGASTRRALYDTAHEMLISNVGPGRRTTYKGGLAVYGKARRPCPRCNRPIKSASTGTPARVTYWCDTCQPPPASGVDTPY